ncbi:RbsC [Desulforapulum autotrophicum HRM2]|uniref:RbsC n=1 Tax=Desulforapulum autotrophicum (strain ATCC 43914 / DSM 3382 / VKM B-1955 / HRM2) TaxID=177437 RepID=C0Q931_DESAH|nr:ABC transporter permease [Desulforapulum autotrophicum]ACN16536.1 RbsC [Desulforapulum autotrophicum HRM2]
MKASTARYGTAMVGSLIFIFFCIAAENFLSVMNILTVLKQISVLTILAIGFSFALTTSELDLSFANVCSLSMVVTGGLIYNNYPVLLAVFCGIATGTLAGLLNGIIVTRFKVPSLIATLGVSSMANGAAFWVTEGVAYVGRWPKPFLFLGRGKVLGIPMLALWMLALALISLFVMKKTRLGIHMIFTGEADEASRLSGIPVKRIKVIGLTLSGFCAGLAAVLLTSSLSSASPTGGADFMLTTMAAVLLGMTMIEPGRPNIAGSFIGALIIGILSNGLVLMGAPYYAQDIILGVIIIGSVGFSASSVAKAAFSI